MSEVAARRNRLLLTQWADLLENDSFRRFWLMRLSSNTAANALTYSLLVFTVRESTAALAAGGLLLTLVVPSALLGAFAGVLVDRLPRGLILFLCQALRAALVFVLMGAKDSLWALYPVSFALSTVTQFAVPAEAAVLPHVVRPDRMTAASSFMNLGTLTSQVLGMLVLAPVFLKTTDGDPLLIILIALFAIAGLILTIIPQFNFTSPDGQAPVTVKGARREFAESWLALSRDSVAYLSLVLLVVTNTSVYVLATLLPKFSVQVLAVAPENIVFILAPAAVSVFLGLRCVEWLANRFNKLVTISAAYLMMAAALIALGLVPATGDLIRDLDPLGLFSAGPLNGQTARIGATILHASVYGFSFTVVMTMGRVLLYERVPHRMQGRVFAAQHVLGNLASIVPILLAGLLADAVGVAPVLLAAGVVALLAATWSRVQGSRTVPASA